MSKHTAPGRLVAVLAVSLLLGACATGASPSPSSSTLAPANFPSAVSATSGPTAASTTTPAPTPSVVATYDVAYESANPVFAPGVLDVYAPAKAGPWPVVVMLNGYGGEKGGLSEHARKVADLGFVVFSADWGVGPETALTYELLLAMQPQTACAVAFARAHAAEYGGDAATMIVFGHAAGANFAALVAFARPEPTAGCLGGTTLGAIDALVTWDGGWLLAVPIELLDPVLAADSRVLDVATPWTYLTDHRDLKVVMLAATTPTADISRDRPVSDPWAADSWLAMRDPSGVLRRQLEANGAFADGILDSIEEQQLLYSVLEAQGNPVSLDVMPGSSGTNWSDQGWKIFLAAFPKAAAED